MTQLVMTKTSLQQEEARSSRAERALEITLRQLQVSEEQHGDFTTDSRWSRGYRASICISVSMPSIAVMDCAL